MLAHPKDVIELPAIMEPHQGMLYNLAASVHQALLLHAHEIEERCAKEEARLAEAQLKIEQVRTDNPAPVDDGYAWGMMVDRIQAEDDDDGVEAARELQKALVQKTKAQWNKAAKPLAEVSTPERSGCWP